MYSVSVAEEAHDVTEIVHAMCLGDATFRNDAARAGHADVFASRVWGAGTNGAGTTGLSG